MDSSETGIVLNSRLIVPPKYVTLDTLADFKATIRKKDGEEINYDFFDYNQQTECYEFARGDLALITKHFGKYQIRDDRVQVPMSINEVVTDGAYGLSFTATLKPEQKVVTDFIMDHKITAGQIEAPPRYGKTITLVNLTTRMAQKTLFLCHQIDLARQIYRSFIQFTNATNVEYNINRQVVGIVDDWDDLDKFDVAILTYQKFVSGTDNLENLARYSNRFGAVFVDEAHIATSPWYAKIVAAFNSYIRMGVSATPERKDQSHIINDYILGPVVIKGKTQQMPCQVFAVQTGCYPPYQFGNNPASRKVFFSKAYSYLATNLDRNRLLFQYLKAYAEAGHFCIAVTERSAHCEIMAEALRKVGIPAEAFHAKRFRNQKMRDACLDRVRSGETKVLIAIRRMVLGLDLPRLTAFFNLLPSANAPAYYQEYSRVRTPFETKQMAYIIDFVDAHPILKGCYKSRRKLYHKENFPIQGDID